MSGQAKEEHKKKDTDAEPFGKTKSEELSNRSYGFPEQLIMWINDFLADRKQRVVIGLNKSKWCTVNSGVPQRSALSTRSSFVSYFYK